MLRSYDIIIVGGGHAGCEAAMACGNLGMNVLLITHDMDRIAQMSCNPAIGGIAKGQIVREIDSLGGYMGIVTDFSSIQFRMLNRSKGPAMWSPRSQCDRILFSRKWRTILESNSNISFWQDSVEDLIIRDKSVHGVITKTGIEFFAKKVILTTGTFLNGLMHIGSVQIEGGRISEPASKGLSDKLQSLGFNVGRMKTGTPVRVDGRSVDFSQMEEQAGEDSFYKFSYLPDSGTTLNQRSCYITYTNSDVHSVINKGLSSSPMYDGTIQSTGPRYCPSIETKIVTFPDKSLHQLYLEPEGESTVEYYLNGFSSSLPSEIQFEALRLVPGLQNAKFFRAGYAIEYDYLDPQQLYHTLQSKLLNNLYLAGQINGTTGYEEAAAQGLIAGINASLNLKDQKLFKLDRDEAYIGVLIDDLVTKGVDEPYRMFTSRAEYRILLRQDDADVRLTPRGYSIGLVNKERYSLLQEKIRYRDEIINLINNISIKPEQVNPYLKSVNSSSLKQGVKLSSIVTRPHIKLKELGDIVEELDRFYSTIPGERFEEIIESAEILIKYSGYITRERKIADKLHRLENIYIKDKFDYSNIHTISTEGRQKLALIKPETIGQASRISGVSPADINVLLVLLGR
ncbi:tRNA uridine-5-carboxymethylaminomethyl(34) synthesis enzyme MnmG [Marinilabiliaceae bacterium ANBcel2]|nr:tRNA uridine-5-carboxymethylaminomethyl(34) synthesis enzyme MnmG [Marinilabiliaceae bacterium ANBcel2]